MTYRRSPSKSVVVQRLKHLICCLFIGLFHLSMLTVTSLDPLLLISITVFPIQPGLGSLSLSLSYEQCLFDLVLPISAREFFASVL